MKSLFFQKIVVITGSSMGIGKSMALSLARQKAKIVINARSIDKLIATENEMKALGFDVLAVAGDVTLEEDCKRLIETRIAHFGTIDILINNAGVSMRGAVEDLSPQVIATVFNSNAVASYVLTKIAMPYIKKNKGSVVFISSLAALRGLPYLSVYSSAKMALKGLAQSLRIEHVNDGIHIGLIYIGITKIDKGKTTLGSNGTLIDLEQRDGLLANTANYVAEKIVRNIALRKRTTVVSVTGKFYYFLVSVFPFLIELILNHSQKRLKKLYS